MNATTATDARRAARLAEQANTSQAVADAYRHLATLIVTDPKLARLVESELARVLAQADEYDRDAEDRLAAADAGNYEPESSQRNADVRAERDCDDWPLGVGVLR